MVYGFAWQYKDRMLSATSLGETSCEHNSDETRHLDLSQHEGKYLALELLIARLYSSVSCHLCLRAGRRVTLQLLCNSPTAHVCICACYIYVCITAIYSPNMRWAIPVYMTLHQIHSVKPCLLLWYGRNFMLRVYVVASTLVGQHKLETLSLCRDSRNHKTCRGRYIEIVNHYCFLLVVRT